MGSCDANPPDPLSLAALDYARACKAAGVRGGEEGALARYARLYREGFVDQPGSGVVLPRIGRTLTSESNEGTVLKFTLLVAKAASNRGHALVQVGGAGDEVEVESVLIPMIGKKRRRTYTLCVSSQVGCAMGCTFCQTAQMGLIRSLGAAEIVAQWFAARHIVPRPDPDAPITNVVFMGMGEPMDNLDEVVRAISVLTDRRGPGIAMGKVTVSTVGRIDGIRRLAEQVREPGWHRLGLAVSLNSPSDAVRSSIMPINRSTPMAALREALCAWPIYGGAHLCIEYVLIPGVTDGPEAPQQLASFMLGDAFNAPGAGEGGTQRFSGSPLVGLVNVILYNPRDRSPWPAPTEESVEAFVAKLSSLGVYVKRRRTKGRDTMAACGQLGNPALRRVRAGASA